MLETMLETMQKITTLTRAQVDAAQYELGGTMHEAYAHCGGNRGEPRLAFLFELCKQLTEYIKQEGEPTELTHIEVKRVKGMAS
jgi:hypothetical protein